MAPLVLPAPMKAVTGVLPGDDEDGWAYEIKWDGMRVVAGVADGEVQALSTRGLDLVPRFPELDGLAEHLRGHRVVLDGEMVAFAGERTDFGLMQQRMHVTTRFEADRRRAQVPVCFVVFDLLHLDGIDTTPLPYVDRRRLLSGLVEPTADWLVPAHRVGDGAALLAAAAERGLEGIMAKRLGSPYLPGRRSPTWRKVKVRRRQELVVGGWTPGEGGRATTFGALLLGYHDDDAHDGRQEDDRRALRFAGAVGTGFDETEGRRIRALLDDLTTATSPFAERLPTTVKQPTWVRPELVVEVEFGEWTGEGRLRHPAYVGQRIDADPRSVVREPGFGPGVSDSNRTVNTGDAHGSD